MIHTVLPTIPRALSALAEWFSCVIFLLPIRKRFSDSVTLLLLIIALTMQMGAQFLAARISSPIGFYAGMAANVGIMFLTFIICGKITVNCALYWTMYAFSMAEFLASLDWQVAGGVFNMTSLLTPIAILTTFVLFSAMLLFSRTLTRSANYEVDRYPWVVTFNAAGIAVMQFLGSNLIPNFLPWWENAWMGFSFGLIRTVLDFAGVMVLFLFLKTLEEQDRRKTMDSLTQIMNMQYQQHLDFLETSAYISRQCHDLKHQVAALRSACTPEEKERYLGELEEMIIRYQSYCNTGNKVLDSILTQKAVYCGQHGICLSYDADGAGLEGMPVHDLCVIFGNLLDNAIESVEKIQEAGKRQILLEVFQKGGFLMIQVENCCLETPFLIDELPQTTKPDKAAHGYGLKSVQVTVQKHGGTLRCYYEEGWFVSRILIPKQ